MSLVITLRDENTRVQSLIARAYQACGGQATNLHIAEAVRDGVQGSRSGYIPGIKRHITDQGPSHHKTAKALGASPTHYYEAAAEGIQGVATDSEASVIIVNGAKIFSHWLNRVVIRPKAPKVLLALPNLAVAYGVKPEEFGDRLQFEPRGRVGFLTWRTHPKKAPLVGPPKPRKAAVARTAATAHTASEADLPVVYWCVPQVVLEPDPSLLPTKEQILKLMIGGASRAFRAAMQPRGLHAA
jgi:hypothetical protein